MLSTLYNLGRQLSEKDYDPWSDFLADYKPQDKKKPDLHYLNLPIVFYPGDERVAIGEKSSFDPRKSPGREGYRYIKVRGGNYKAVYPTVEPKQLDKLERTLFGKENKGSYPETGELLPEAAKFLPDMADTTLGQVLAALPGLREQWLELLQGEDGEKGGLEVLAAKAGLANNEAIALLVTAVCWPEMGIEEPTPLVHLPGFEEFVDACFLQEKAGREGLDYSTGQMSTQIVAAEEFKTRYSLNKMFTSTTWHGAQGLQPKNYDKNYQLDANSLSYMERGSKYLLDNFRVTIADIEHVIIPMARSASPVDYTQLGVDLQADTELLFQSQKSNAMSNRLHRKSLRDLTWITFLAIESDGNFFKSLNLIQEVQHSFLILIDEQLVAIDTLMRETPGTRWARVCGDFAFNLRSVYSLIPVRKDKEKVNKALIFFKNILERRPVERKVVFDYFTELLLCHRYGRYPAYKNVREHKEPDYAISEATIQYQALLLLLTRLNLMTMTEAQEGAEVLPQKKDYMKDMQEFMQRMGYTDPACMALFYLGRALNVVAYQQAQKSHSKKPILNKVDFNGMDWAKLCRLNTDLREKTQQYGLHKKMEPLLGRFYQYMPPSATQYALSPQEGLFYLFAGYSYSNPKDAAADADGDSETQDS